MGRIGHITRVVPQVFTMVGTSVGAGSPKLVTCLQSLLIPGYFGGGKGGYFTPYRGGNLKSLLFWILFQNEWLM